MLAPFVKLSGVCVGEAQHVSGKRNYRCLHSKADAKVRNVVSSGIGACGNFSFNTSGTEPPWHQNAVYIAQKLVNLVFILQFLRLYPFDFHIYAVFVASVAESLSHRKVSVVELNVFSDKGDGDLACSVVDSVQHLHPAGHFQGSGFNVQLSAYDLGEVLFFKHYRGFVQLVYIQILNDAVLLYIAEEGDLVQNVVVHHLRCTENYDVRRDAKSSQLLYRVLCRL